MSLNGLKKNLGLSIEQKRLLIEPDNNISISRQCELLGLNRSSYYYEIATETPENLEIMKIIDKEFTAYPNTGTRVMTLKLESHGFKVNRKRLQRLYKVMGIDTVFPKKNTSKRCHEHRVYPYLLRNVKASYPNHIWSTDITYIPMYKGFVYLMAIIDWYSRYVIDWEISSSLESQFCIEAVNRAFKVCKCEIFNTDQGAQFTSTDFVEAILSRGVKLSMDGKGRALDNVFIERLWRSVKYEKIFFNEYLSTKELYNSLKDYFRYYNCNRPHLGLSGKYPKDLYYNNSR